MAWNKEDVQSLYKCFLGKKPINSASFLFATKYIIKNNFRNIRAHQRGLLPSLAFVVVSSMVKVEGEKQKHIIAKVIYSSSKITSYLINLKQIERLTKNASMDDLWFSTPNNPAYVCTSVLICIYFFLCSLHILRIIFLFVLGTFCVCNEFWISKYFYVLCVLDVFQCISYGTYYLDVFQCVIIS